MINLMVANKQPNTKYKDDRMERLIKAQIENALEVNWKPEKIIVLANFDICHYGIKTYNIELNGHCLTGSKIYAVDWLLGNDDIKDVIWSHDLDCWQNEWFEAPEFNDVGITTYSTKKYNGGCVFWRHTAHDLVQEIKAVIDNGETKEEPTINKLLKDKSNEDRVTVINNTYNVGCSGFVVRARKADKPIKLAHFNPYNRIAWETHRLDRNGIGIKSISERLEKLLRKHFDLAYELSEEGKRRQKELMKKYNP